MIGIQPEGQKSSIFVGNDNLRSKRLPFVPIHGDLKFAILVQTLDYKDVVIQINPSVLHHGPDPSDISSMEQTELGIQRLAKNFCWWLQILNLNPGKEFRFVLNKPPILPSEQAIDYVCVNVKIVGAMMLERGLDAQVVDEGEFRLVEADQVDNIGNYKVIRTRFIVESVKEFL